MIENLRSEGFPWTAELAIGLTEKPTVAVRLNPLKMSEGDAPDVALTPGAEPVGWEPLGLYLPERPEFTLDPQMHQGRYYVQDASSMFVGHVIRHLTADGEAVCCLDACAAPGGKTTAIAAVMPEGSMLVANEVVPRRAVILRENVIKWGDPRVMVTRADTANLGRLREAFDIVVVDAPCSGEGMMRKDREAVEQWSRKLIAECSARQRLIVDNLWESLRPGGYLVYSTCTFNRSENEEILEYIVGEYGAEPVEIPTDTHYNICGGVATALPCHRFVPGITRGEGLFLGVVRKPGSGKARRPEKRNFEKAKVDVILDPREGQYETVGKALVASHQWVMRHDYAGEEPRVEVDLQQALSYLRHEAIVLDEGAPKGYVVLTYKGRPLGLAKNLGNRANNLYPQEWRIRNL